MLPSSQVLAADPGTAFTYQGRLTESGSAVSQSCDFQFSLYDASEGGSQVGTTLTKTGVTVSSGLFTMSLDFGASAFTGSAGFLAIAVRCPTGSSSYTTLSPRQELTPTPYALHSTGNWSLTGDASTTAGTNLVGTTDAIDLVFKANNAEAMRIASGGNVGIGETSPASKLHIQSSTAAAFQIDPFGTNAGNTGEERFLELAANGTNYVGW